MEETTKLRKINKIVVLESKLCKVREANKEKKTERDQKKQELQREQKREAILIKKRERLNFQKSSLQKRVDFFDRKERIFKAEKKKIEISEEKEKDIIQRRRIEKERWLVEENRRKIEEKKWKIEDYIQKINKEIKETERELTEDVKRKTKNLFLEITKIESLLKKYESWNIFLSKKIIDVKKKEKERSVILERKIFKKEKEIEKEQEIVKQIRLNAKKREEELRKKREKEEELLKGEKEKEIEKEQEIVKQICLNAKKREEELRKKREKEEEFLKEKLEEEEKKSEIEEKFKELFYVIEKNKEEINFLKEGLAEKEKKREKLEERGVESEQENKQIDIIREQIRKEQEILAAKEKAVDENSIYKKPEEDKKIETPIQEEVEQQNRPQIREEFFTPPPDVQQSSGAVMFNQKEIDSLKSHTAQKLSQEEAEALFKKAEKSFYAGSMQSAKARFQRIIDNYYPDENKGILGKIGKSLDVRAGEYIRKIEGEKEKKQKVILINNNTERLSLDIQKERKEIEQNIQQTLEERKKIEEEIKKAEEEENLQEVARFSHQFEEIEGKRNSLERELGKNIEETERRKENPYSNPTIIREIVREPAQETMREDIKEEIRKIIEEKAEMEREIEIAMKKKEEEEKKEKEIRKREKEIEEEKEKLNEKEKNTESGEEKAEIKKRKEEMERELRRLITEETTEKWEKRIRKVENEVMRVNMKYEDLTKKEEVLRGKIQEIGTWGPESRKKEKDIDTYRSLYGKTTVNTKQEELKKSDFSDQKKSKRSTGKSSDGLNLKSLKPSKDFFLKTPILISLDISDYSLEVFALNEQKVITSFGRTLLEEGIIYNGEIREKEKLKKVVIEVLKKTKPYPIIKKTDRRIKGAINLPESKIFVQQVKIKKEEKILEKIKSEIERTIPVSIEELYFHYHDIPMFEGDEKVVLCVAVEQRIVKQYIEFLQSIDIDPIIFDLEAASLGRSLLTIEKNEKNEKQKKEDEMIIDIGARSTTVSIFRNKTLSFSVSIPFGGAYFTEKIAKKLDITNEEAENRKKRIGLRGELKNILTDSLEKILKEIREAERYYSREIGGEIEKIIIVGGSSLVPGLLEYFKEELGEIVSIGRPLEKIKANKEIDEKESLVYTSVIGLALRTTEKDPIETGLNMLPEEIRKIEKRHQQERRRTVWIGAIILAALGIIALFFSLYYAYAYYSEKELLEDGAVNIYQR